MHTLHKLHAFINAHVCAWKGSIHTQHREREPGRDKGRSANAKVSMLVYPVHDCVYIQPLAPCMHTRAHVISYPFHTHFIPISYIFIHFHTRFIPVSLWVLICLSTKSAVRRLPVRSWRSHCAPRSASKAPAGSCVRQAATQVPSDSRVHNWKPNRNFPWFEVPISSSLRIPVTWPSTGLSIHVPSPGGRAIAAKDAKQQGDAKDPCENDIKKRQIAPDKEYERIR